MKQMAVGLRVAVPSLVVAFLVAACGSADGMPEGSAAVDAPAPEEAVDIAADSEASPEADTSSVGTGNAPAATGDPTAVATASLDSEPDTTPPKRTFFFFTRPDHIRGLYVNSWSAGSRRRMAALIDLARRTEVNTFVIDIKDASGYVSHPSEVPLAKETGATGDIRIPSMSWLLGELEAAGIYPVARIVIVKDPVLAAAHPELAVQDTAGGVWTDNNGVVWLNPFNKAVWEYHVDLAREVAEMGFPEIQWDYVRFPDAPASALGRAHFPGRNGQPRTTAIREFLAYSRDALADLEVDVTADVFGVTTSATRDVGIGQVWESFIDVVDVALPMVYPSHYWKGSYGFEEPNAHPYEIVRKALRDALERSAALEGAGATRPWLQDFTLGPPRYEAPEVRAQIQAAHDLGIMEWVLWNPGSRYTEDALEPAEGFAAEPMVRVGNQVVPVSMRFELFDTTTVVAQPDEEGESGDGAPGPESGGTPAADTLPDPGAARPDTVGAGIGR
ncbi:MAG: putative glycoside hydrolase [Gemmatimonadetes bacterium]|nr:putative glycoside hydrolase [Gemmatimonadota bacterium]